MSYSKLDDKIITGWVVTVKENGKKAFQDVVKYEHDAVQLYNALIEDIKKESSVGTFTVSMVDYQSDKYGEMFEGYEKTSQTITIEKGN